MTPRLWRRIRASARERLRNRFGERLVRRTVAGATLTLPWSHRLPDYVRVYPTYGRNLVDLAEALSQSAAPKDRPLQVVDLGANVGDSALQILARVDARVLCIDGDPYWLPFLHRNVDHEPRCTVAAALIVEHVDATALTAVRRAGTTRFEPAAAGVETQQLTAEQLRDQCPEFDSVRLIKSDIDGFDCRIVPLLAAAWRDTAPVLFFEYDEGMSHKVGDDNPRAVWDKLAALGYAHVAVWDNLGVPLGNGSVDEVRARAAATFGTSGEPAQAYWDVAVATADDSAGRAVLEKLAPERIAT